jgi:hypothetical protein
MEKCMNLNEYLSRGSIPDVGGLMSLISSRCRKKTKDTLKRRLTTQVSLLKQCGIFTRMTYGENGWDYCCGQSWNDEMRTIRECLIDGIM